MPQEWMAALMLQSGLEFSWLQWDCGLVGLVFGFHAISRVSHVSSLAWWGDIHGMKSCHGLVTYEVMTFGHGI